MHGTRNRNGRDAGINHISHVCRTVSLLTSDQSVSGWIALTAEDTEAVVPFIAGSLSICDTSGDQDEAGSCVGKLRNYSIIQGEILVGLSSNQAERAGEDCDES